MHNRNYRRDYRGPRSRRGRRRNLGWMIALGTAVPVLAVGYFLASPGADHAVPSADVQGAVPAAVGGAVPGWSNVGGWGKGGYPMVGSQYPAPSSAGTGSAGTGSAGTGSAGTGSAGEAANAPGTNAAVTQVTSENWAGYAATGAANSFTSVSSSWAQPAVTCGQTDTFSSFWVGLDGDGTPTVEQTGTEADCANGAASYQGWFEIFPDAPVFYPNPVQPGDAMSASVVAAGNGEFTLTLSDTTQGWQQVTHQSVPSAQLGSAEVIAEAPSNGTVLPLADFGTVNFTGATVNNAAIGNSANLSELTMESPTDTALATPSALTGGNAFSVTSDAAAAATPTPTPTGSTGTGSGSGGGGAGDGGGRHHHPHDLSAFGF
jgi:hypothetical protein